VNSCRTMTTPCGPVPPSAFFVHERKLNFEYNNWHKHNSFAMRAKLKGIFFSFLLWVCISLRDACIPLICDRLGFGSFTTGTTPPAQVTPICFRAVCDSFITWFVFIKPRLTLLDIRTICSCHVTEVCYHNERPARQRWGFREGPFRATVHVVIGVNWCSQCGSLGHDKYINLAMESQVQREVRREDPYNVRSFPCDRVRKQTNDRGLGFCTCSTCICNNKGELKGPDFAFKQGLKALKRAFSRAHGIRKWLTRPTLLN